MNCAGGGVWGEPVTTYSEKPMPVYPDEEPMNPERLELSTNGLKVHCSTIELRVRSMPHSLPHARRFFQRES